MAKPRMLLLRTLAGTLLLTAAAGCGSSTAPDPGDPVGPQFVTVTATSTSVEIATQVQLTATVGPAGVSQSVTWSSGDDAAATVNASGLVTPLLRGTVTITARSTADAAVFGTIDLAVVCPEPRAVTANLTGKTEWENWVADPGCYDYVVETTIEMAADTLTLQPGTVVGFADGVQVRIRNVATLLAEGTEDLPIVLTGLTKERGAWQGLGLETSVPTHVLAWTTIEYTSGSVALSQSKPAGLKVNGGGKVRLEHSTLRESEGYGLWLGNGVDVPGDGANTMTANALGPAYAYGAEVEHVVAGASEITGNDLDEVVVYPNSITNAAAWPFGAFRVEDPAGQNFNVLGSLTLGAGVTIRFEGAGELLRVRGALTAVGTLAEPILLTGTEAVPGYWAGVQFLGSDASDNRLEYVMVEYGGGFVGKVDRGNVMIESDGGVDSRVAIVNSTFRQSVDYGVYAGLGTTLSDFSGNTMTQNGLGPLSIDAPVMRFVAADNQMTGNVVDEITVHAGTGRALDDGATWYDFGLPYYVKRFNSLEWEIRASFALQPGVVLQMDPGMILSFEQGGGLVAEGTVQDEIVFEAHSDPWGALRFIDATGSLDYATVDGGGANAREALIIIETIDVNNAPASVVNTTANVTLTGATYSISFGYGDTYAPGCPGAVFIPPPDTPSDHCVLGS